MKIQMIVALCTLVIAEIIFFGSDRSGDSMSLGLGHLVISIFSFFIGLILLLIKKTRHYGEGVLLGTGLLLLTGLFLCSN